LMCWDLEILGLFCFDRYLTPTFVYVFRKSTAHFQLKIAMKLRISCFSEKLYWLDFIDSGVLRRLYKKYPSISRGVFFAFHGTYAGGRGWKWVKIKIIQLFLRCLKILDANLNWILIGEGVKIVKKSQNSKKIA